MSAPLGYKQINVKTYPDEYAAMEKFIKGETLTNDEQIALRLYLAHVKTHLDN